MKLIVGLGNPGREYEGNRHNVGFMIVDLLSRRLRIPLSSQKFDGELGQGSGPGDRLLLLRPQTFMNLSGRSVGAAARFYKVPPEDTLVVHDELDLPLGRLQLKSGGGSGGHNGLRSITDALGTEAYPRLRFGVDKPTGPDARDRVSGWVLSDFRGEEAKLLPELLVRACEMAECWAEQGLAAAMNRFNRR